MARELKVVDWERTHWQEAFYIGRNFYLCPYCGEKIYLPRPWGICMTKEERKLDRSLLPGHTIHRCPLCSMNLLKPSRKETPDARD